ncbi:MAG: MATE family efflux transporter [Parabacteroides sp.]|nr:MATE family efflux transporter [Parabacteroides sp.]
MDYIQVLPFTFFFLILAFTLVNLVEADGHPKLAMKAVALSSLFNVLLDVLFVKYLDFGIQGLALAMLSNYLAVTLFFILRMRRSGVSYRWIMPRKNILYVTKAGIKEGLPIMINDLLYSLMIFGVNSLLLAYCGETELYFWAVFLQLLLLVMVIVDCAEGAILSIGSVLLGENDWFGLRVLVRRVWLLVGGLAMLVVVLVWIFPGPIGKIFSDSDTVSHGWPQAVRILSLMLVPYALTTFMRSLFQLLGHKVGGIIFSVGQFILMATVLYAMIHWNPTYLWWSFPIASWMLFILQMMYMLRLRHQQRISALSIIPVTPRKNVLDLSVAYEEEAVLNTIHRICLFLEENEVDLLMQMEINICCEELMLNIVRYQTYKTRSYMDLSVSLMEDKVLFVLKDSGRPFNPVLAVRSPEMLIEEDTPLGLFLANSVCKELTHKYMYGLNVVFAEFRK